MTKCVLMLHGLTLGLGNKTGVCCYNHNDPSTYSSYDIDPTGCRACIDQEDNGIKSYRQGANEQYGLEHNHRSPIVLDITPNFNCNLTCKICSEHSSSSWAKIKQIKIKKSYNIAPVSVQSKLENLDLGHVREINFSGGEPLLNHNIIKYIEPLGNRIDFSQCNLRFSTNGTHALSDRLINFLSKFKLVLARFSIDDIEQGFEYQRYPATWNQCQANWNQFLESMPHNTIPSINRTVSILNIRRLHLLDAWHQQYPTTRFTDPIELIDHFVFGDYSLLYLTPELKENIRLSGHQRAWNYVKNRQVTVNVDQLKQTIQQHDALHNTSLENFDPDLYKAIFR